MKICYKYFNIKLLLFAISFLVFSHKSFSQTGLMVTYYDGTQQGYTIAESGKLYFASDNLMIVVAEAASPTSIPISIIKKLTFSSSIVPLKLVEFSAKKEKEQIVLYWQTANEINNSHFIIERSFDGLTYENIGQVAALNATANNYVWVDYLPKDGINYYRLKQVDIDGKYTYSKVVMINRTTSINISLLPNPANSFFTINASTSEKLSVKIYSATGQLMLTGNYISGEQINISKLAAGMYVAIIDNKPYKIVKQ